MPYLQRSEDLNIFYTLHGDASNPPFLLIHGWTCDSTDWSWTIPALIEKYYVVTIDLRGHGHSSAPESTTYTIKDSADDAVALLEELKLTKDVLVMGHSMGGIMASVLTGLYPEIFRGLVIIDPPYWRTKKFWADMLPKWDELQNGFLFVTMAFGNQLPPEMPPWMMTWYGLRAQATAEHAVVKSLQGAFAPDMLGQQEAHAELVKGRAIPRLGVYMREENVENEKKLGVGAKDEIVQLADAGHWLHHMKPDEFNGILTKWLEKIEAK
ncbi:alpha/beta-hydrolase [Cucurbitaria berberidis CBS 394.84]|uniref:Alpha/beta-hydrolase n=1 Tax=Cucurbitaria berberidis CBS 394.84 TaxID=1168544 RepID=A0A9P4GVQ0_9PLEO|nr:alpha/beta-hydrolase [Cucurbitaria berberidis CBS 394.84]KAF1852177.1 alpha/beta-hydrolase [Cucurbitaria berberidis CBS 394.84]